jgi:hypothetical protein
MESQITLEGLLNRRDVGSSNPVFSEWPISKLSTVESIMWSYFA